MVKVILIKTNSMLKKMYSETGERKHIHLGNLVGCLRAEFLKKKIKKIPKKKGNKGQSEEERIKRILIGNQVHYKIGQYLDMTNNTILYKGYLWSSIDGRIPKDPVKAKEIGLEDYLGWPVEIKTYESYQREDGSYSRRYDSLGEIEEFKEHHMKQILYYLAIRNERKGLLIYININTWENQVFEIELTEEEIEQLKKEIEYRYALLQYALDRNDITILPKEGNEYFCNNICDYKDYCLSNKYRRVNMKKLKPYFPGGNRWKEIVMELKKEQDNRRRKK